MLPHDPKGENGGVKARLSDVVDILQPKNADSVAPVPAVARVSMSAAAPAQAYTGSA